MILLIDNYDSYSYNLYQLIGAFDTDIKVIRNDVMDVAEIRRLRPSHIVLSPGPGYPRDAGICIEAARALGRNIPLLGVCLGHQAICEAFGATVTHAKKMMHGKQSQTRLNGSCPLFKGVPDKARVARYHSLAVLRETIPACLAVTAEADDGDIMGVMHREYPIYGLQFHPESILTDIGTKIMENFLNLKGSDSHD
ncbi:Aminodeoxychorismate synthase component 2 [bioreactor metagenome]|uniref:Aminodeoxychorismate synthase component 2 n=1 Tax=bioreactor metagenome TaxID=1076179 RepID=A0A645CJR4_9ZZZZ